MEVGNEERVDTTAAALLLVVPTPGLGDGKLFLGGSWVGANELKLSNPARRSLPVMKLRCPDSAPEPAVLDADDGDDDAPSMPAFRPPPLAEKHRSPPEEAAPNPVV